MDNALFGLGVLTAFNAVFTLAMVLKDHKDAKSAGFNEGFDLGWREGCKAKHDEVFDENYDEGFDAGFDAGWDECEACYDLIDELDEIPVDTK